MVRSRDVLSGVYAGVIVFRFQGGAAFRRPLEFCVNMLGLARALLVALDPASLFPERMPGSSPFRANLCLASLPRL